MILQNNNIMKQLFLIALIALFNVSIAKSCLIAFKKKPTNDTILVKAKRLEELYIKATGPSGNNDIYEKQFFNEFPSTFKELNELYGYKKDTIAVLYNSAEKHIFELFNNLNTIKDTL